MNKITIFLKVALFLLSIVEVNAENYSLVFYTPDKLTSSRGTIRFSPTISSVDESKETKIEYSFVIDYYDMVDGLEKAHHSFSISGAEAIDAILLIPKMKDNEVITRKDIISISRNGNSLTIVSHRIRNGKIDPFELIFDLKDATVFAEKVKKKRAWIMSVFEK